jgi:hypothetical protein
MEMLKSEKVQELFRKEQGFPNEDLLSIVKVAQEKMGEPYKAMDLSKIIRHLKKVFDDPSDPQNERLQSLISTSTCTKLDIDGDTCSLLTKIDFWGRRLFRINEQSSWESLNAEARRVVKAAENSLFVDSLTSHVRVSRLKWTRTVQRMYEKTDEQLKKEWCITRLFNRIQEFVLGIAKVREAFASRVEKLFRGYSEGLLVEHFAESRFLNFRSLMEEVTDGQGRLLLSKDAPLRYFVKEELLQERASRFAKTYETYW